MPHKRNPVLTENLTGLARLVRMAVVPALENVALWHERDISHSSVERAIGPDATITLDFALHRLAGVVEKLVVYPDNMLKNLAARPPDDPVAAEARRLAWQALHQPKRCDGFEWTSSSLGLLGSLTGTVATIAGAPAGPADWALLGAALSGDAASAASLFKCITQAAETPLQAVHN